MFNIASYIDFLSLAARDLEGVLTSFLAGLQAGFMIALMLGFSIGRALPEQYGNYRVFTTTFIVYATVSYLCFIRQSFLLFLSGCTLLGFAGGLTALVG
jgi:DHA2 family multidrug resistance protein